MSKKFNYFYKITNNINNHFYYGIHSTDNLNDGYMGSGHRLQNAYKKYGIENFTKEILKYFDTRKKCAEYEASIVTEQLVIDDNCYNIKLGGEGWNTQNMLPVFDIKLQIKKLVHKDEYNNNKNNYTLVGCDFSKNILVKYKTSDEYFIITKEEYYKNKQLYNQFSSNTVVVKDKNGKIFKVTTNDERYIKGDLVFIWQGRKHSEETKQKIKNNCKQYNFHKGISNPMYGKRWVNKDEKSILINNTEIDLYIQNGWKKGKAKKIIIDSTKPTLEQLNNKYNELQNWRLVADYFNITLRSLKYLRTKYKQVELT